MPFTFTTTEVSGVIIIEPKSFNDDRGFFLETYKRSEFNKAGIKLDFQQDNSSYSEANVMRGLHFQRPPFEQGKLVRVISGKIIDVAVDLRVGSPSFGKYVSVVLDDENKKMLYIPPGFAHGFLTLKKSYVHYKVTKEYNKDSEGGLLWNDPSLGVNWPAKEPLVIDKDKSWPRLKDLKSPFKYGVY